MNQAVRPHGYRGAYLIGFVMIGVVAVRALLFYHTQSNLGIVISLIGMYALLYSFEPWLSHRLHWHTYIYFSLQTVLAIILSNLRPFLDFQSLLYFPIWIQVFRTLSRQAIMIWTLSYVTLLGITLLLGMGLLHGFVNFLNFLAVGAFLISYDLLYARTQSDREESQRLLVSLQSAHQKLQEQAAQAEKLAAARERNRLARELHDSVSQIIFSIALTSQAARLLLEQDPARVQGEIQRLQEMTSHALMQLRSIIAELHPPLTS